MDAIDQLIEKLKRLEAQKKLRRDNPWFANPRENKSPEFDQWRLYLLEQGKRLDKI